MQNKVCSLLRARDPFSIMFFNNVKTLSLIIFETLVTRKACSKGLVLAVFGNPNDTFSSLACALSSSCLLVAVKLIVSHPYVNTGRHAFFHSSTIVLGLTPYSYTPASCKMK